MDLATSRAEDRGSPSPASPTASRPSPTPRPVRLAARRGPQPGSPAWTPAPLQEARFPAVPLCASPRVPRPRSPAKGVFLLEGLIGGVRNGTGLGAGETEVWVALRRRQGHSGTEVFPSVSRARFPSARRIGALGGDGMGQVDRGPGLLNPVLGSSKRICGSQGIPGCLLCPPVSRDLGPTLYRPDLH